MDARRHLQLTDEEQKTEKTISKALKIIDPRWGNPEPLKKIDSKALRKMKEELDKTLETAVKTGDIGDLGKLELLRGDPGTIRGELYRLRTACAALRRMRSGDSKQSARAVKTFAAALRRANRRIGGLPEDLRLLLGLERMVFHFDVYEKMWGRDAEVIQDKDNRLRVILKPRRPKPDAFEKRLAAESALHLCQQFGVRPTTTKRAQFCKLAAVLYGDERADLQYHCRQALAPMKGALNRG